MRLAAISVRNFRSIKAVDQVRLEPLQAFVGENNCGKSNMLRAVECFLSSGAGGVDPSDFNDQAQLASIECEFTGLSEAERKKLRPYLLNGDRVVLRKELRIATDPARGRITVKAEFHGYQADPKELHYSLKKIEEKGGKPDWQKLADDGGFLDQAKTEEGKVNKTSFKTALEQFLLENDVEYDDPVLGETQALGIPQNLLSALPEFYLLPAITDYSNEIDRRSSSTVFRRLMADLSERLLRVDPRYQEVSDALKKVRALLNVSMEPGAPARLTALGAVETKLRDTVKGLMPSVKAVTLDIEVEEPRDIFSKGVSIRVDDGVVTDVLDKGHGLQRSLVFALLQMLIESSRGEGVKGARPILLAIEEPELYIHPHSQRLIFGVLKSFAGFKEEGGALTSDQVVYTTHSPAFIEIGNYERIAVVRKPDHQTGTIVRQCEAGVLGTMEEKKGFKLLTSFGLKHNELFFAREAILVEGPEDEVGVIATARKLGRIKDLPDEIGLSIVVTDGKGDVAKFQKVLNAFGFSYGVLLELDGKPEDDKQSAPILANLSGNRIATVPSRLEDLLNVGRHFDDQRHAKEFFSDPDNINAEMEALVTKLLPPATH
jgi:putative ATP-dependent endonuclease of OLD family